MPAMGAAVGPLAASLRSDADRYVRAHAAEALACIAVLAPGHPTDSQMGLAAAGAAAVLAEVLPAEDVTALGLLTLYPNPNPNTNQVLPAEDVAAAVRRCEAVERERGSERGVLVPGAAVEATAQQAVRWLCCRRRCPLTSPDSPF